jgi:hypothetical protein
MSLKNAEHRSAQEDDISALQARAAWERRYVAITVEATDLKAAPPFDTTEKIRAVFKNCRQLKN